MSDATDTLASRSPGREGASNPWNGRFSDTLPPLSSYACSSKFEVVHA